MAGRRHIVVLILLWALIITWGVYLAFESTRMARAQEEHLHDLVQRGLMTYAQNCVVCHGAAGQGVVGPALNREELRGDPSENKDVFEFIVSTVRDGRPGSTFPRWERLETGHWASYTAMPTFGSVHGGPLNELYLRAVATFIMMGDWSQVSSHIPPANIPERDVALSRLPDAAGLSPEDNRRAKELFLDRGCVVCHTISGVGGNVGPELTNVGAWTQLTPVEEWEAFLYNWVRQPSAVENRAPSYWSNYQGPLPFAYAPGAETDLQAPRPLGPTQMPPMPMTDDERAALVRWLARLGR